MTLLALLFAGIAAHLALSGPPRATARAPGPRLPAWLRPREDALRFRTRWAAGAGTGLVAYLLAETLGALLAVPIAALVGVATAGGSR